jgi:hypothetical protein
MGLTTNTNVENLLAILKKNRAGHRELFEEAWAEYRRRVVTAMGHNLDTIKAGGPIDHRITMRTPEDHTEEYDAVIGLLELSTDDTVELTAHDYERFVLDRWEWKRSFEDNTMSYTQH